VVDRQCRVTTAELTRIARALHEAGAHHTRFRSRGGREGIIAVAPTRILKTCIAVAIAAAKVDTLLDSHAIHRLRLAGERARIIVVRSTPNVFPTFGDREVDKIRLRRRKRCYSTLTLWSWSGAIRYRVAARKGGDPAVNLFIDHRGKAACLAFRGSIHGDLMTISDLATVGKAVIDSFLKDINIPAVDEIAVKAVASRVAVGEDERLRVAVPLVSKAVSVIQDLEED
jgi:hypothetical protein